MLRFAFALAAALALWACEDKRSVAFQTLQKLPRVEWIAFAKTLPVPERLALFDEVYSASGHPKDFHLADAFENTGEAGFEAVGQNLISTDAFARYAGILYAIDRTGFDLCAERPFAALRAAASRSGMDNYNLSMIDLGPCELNDKDWRPASP